MFKAAKSLVLIMVKQIKISDRIREFSGSIVEMEKMKSIPRFRSIKDFHEYLVATYMKDNDLVLNLTIKEKAKPPKQSTKKYRFFNTNQFI